MNPLSAWTFYRRHKLRAGLLLALIGLMVMGMYLLPGLALETFFTPTYILNLYLGKFSLVQPELEKELDPAVVSQIRSHPDVAQVLLQNNLRIEIPSVGGFDADFRLIGLQEADIATVMAHSGVTLKEGQMLQPRTNGMLLSEKVATAMGLKVGDSVDRSMSLEFYEDVLSPLELVGILSGDVRLGIVSYEYLDSHELYRDSVNYGLLVIPRPGREAAVDDFLVNNIRSPDTETVTLRQFDESVAEEEQIVYMFGIPIVIVVTIGITLVVGTINRIAFTHRLPEFGTLHATGYDKSRLARRLTMETAGLAVAGWVLGIGLSWLVMSIIGVILFEPRGFTLTPIRSGPLLLTLPIPLAVIGFTLLNARRAFSRLDAVAIVERGELSMETQEKGTMAAQSSSSRPLASATFYRRHKRRAVLLIGTMALMTGGVALLIFSFTTTSDALAARRGNLRRLSIVSPSAGELAPGIVAQIRTHAAAERVIPSFIFSPFGVAVPPAEPNVYLSAYGVSTEDMAYLVELYDLELEEGHLPRPNTNEIVIPKAAALNRNLKVGDVIGNRDQPIHKGAPTLPSELVVSGIFAGAASPEKANWLSFVSLEYMNDYQEYWDVVLSLLVVPKAGQKAALNNWLENEINDSIQVDVITYDSELANEQREMRTLIRVISLMESAIAIVAAIALAGLNYLFMAQRQSEFGVLNALGFDRLQLVWRTVRETTFTAGMAWLLSVVLCGVALLGLLFGLYGPMGLTFNFFNPIPWFYTLPIPIAVLIATSGTIAWTLSRLDPVAVIERR